jgi:hypothetical protein
MCMDYGINFVQRFKVNAYGSYLFLPIATLILVYRYTRLVLL